MDTNLEDGTGAGSGEGDGQDTAIALADGCLTANHSRRIRQHHDGHYGVAAAGSTNHVIKNLAAEVKMSNPCELGADTSNAHVPSRVLFTAMHSKMKLHKKGALHADSHCNGNCTCPCASHPPEHHHPVRPAPAGRQCVMPLTIQFPIDAKAFDRFVKKMRAFMTSGGRTWMLQTPSS